MKKRENDLLVHCNSTYQNDTRQNNILVKKIILINCNEFMFRLDLNTLLLFDIRQWNKYDKHYTINCYQAQLHLLFQPLIMANNFRK